MKGATALAAALALLTGCASAMEWANAPENNRLPNGRCRNPNDATTTIECEQQPPPIARPVEQRPGSSVGSRDRHEDDSSKGAREEVLSKARDGLDAEAGRLFWGLPQEARTTAFASAVIKARTERITSLEAKPRVVADAVATLKLDALPGDKDVLEVLGERIDKALTNLAKHPTAESKDFRLGATLVQVVRVHPAEMEPSATDGLAAFEERFGPVLVAGDIKEEDDWNTFMKLYPDSKYGNELGEHLVQLAQRSIAEQEGQDADRMWEAAQTQGDNLAQLSYKIAFAKKQFDPRRARRGLQNMQLHRQMLVKDGYCPAKKEFVDALGEASFRKRAADHCKDDPPTDGGLSGVGVTLANECKAAFATRC